VEDPLAELLVSIPVFSAETEARAATAPGGRSGTPAAEPGAIPPDFGPRAAEPPLPGVVRPEAAEVSFQFDRDARPAQAAQQQSSGAAELATRPLTPEAAEVVSRPTAETAQTSDPRAVSRAEGVLPDAVAPARPTGQGAERDPATPQEDGRRDGSNARPEAASLRAARQAAGPDGRSAVFDPGRATAPGAETPPEVRESRTAALRPDPGPERGSSEPAPVVTNPSPHPTPPVAGPTPPEPALAAVVRAPEAGTPAEALPMHAEWLAARGGGTARLRLHPPELGEVELSVRVRGSTVQVSIQTEQAEAGKAALDGRELLFEALASRELRVEQLVVRSPEGVTTTADPGDAEDGLSEQLRDQSEGSSERDEPRPRGRETEAPAEPLPDDSRPASGSAVDLRI
jgi:hypothetical protein